MWLPVLVFYKNAFTAKQNAFLSFIYLLNICKRTIIKANAIIVTAIRAENSKKINCNNISIIGITSLLEATTLCFSLFSIHKIIQLIF